MFYYEYEKRASSDPSTGASDWTRSMPALPDRVPYARRPLPPPPCDHKTAVPLKVWIIASASCFAVCAALVLATVCITKWGAGTYTTRELIQTPSQDSILWDAALFNAPPPRSASPKRLDGLLVHRDERLDVLRAHNDKPRLALNVTTIQEPFDLDTPLDEINDLPILERMSMFKNIEASLDTRPTIDTISTIDTRPSIDKDLISKTQIHPLQDDSVVQEERNTKKKDKAIFETDKVLIQNDEMPIFEDFVDLRDNNEMLIVPKFKPILTDSSRGDMDLTYGYDGKEDYFYNDENFYDDYMQSNTMTSYLIEKVQELHDWVSKDPDLNRNRTKNGTDFSSLLKALNESMVDGNLTIVMSKLRDMYFGDNYTTTNNSRKIIVTNNTDLLSFGILTLDIMLLHNIQLMAWENQESARVKMLNDPDVFAFNALFMDPNKLDVKQSDSLIHDGSLFLKRLYPKQDPVEDADISRNLMENILEVGMSTARAAIHLGRAYKNTRNLVTQLQAKNTTVQTSIARNFDANKHALNHLQTSFDSTSVANSNNSSNGSFYTELDCIWLLYCRNLVTTTKLNPPYGTMARINGVALRMLTGELAANRAFDTMIFEVMTGWTDLKCNDMFPRCSKASAANVVLESLFQGHRKSTTNNRGR